MSGLPSPGAVVMPSGIIVPADAADAQQAKVGPTLDLDGRRRAVILKDDARRVHRALKVLEVAGVAVQLRCKNGCGELLNFEGGGTVDPGFGCRCTRIHLGQ